jgi:hypothetical protein
MDDNVPPAAIPAPMRRLPWTTAEGFPCYVPQGAGIINELADIVEADIIRTAVDEGAGAVLLAEESDTTRDDLRSAVRFLACALDDVVKVAELRAERIPTEEPTSDRAQRLSEALRASVRRPAL